MLRTRDSYQRAKDDLRRLCMTKSNSGTQRKVRIPAGFAIPANTALLPGGHFPLNTAMLPAIKTVLTKSVAAGDIGVLQAGKLESAINRSIIDRTLLPENYRVALLELGKKHGQEKRFNI